MGGRAPQHARLGQVPWTIGVGLSGRRWSSLLTNPQCQGAMRGGPSGVLGSRSKLTMRGTVSRRAAAASKLAVSAKLHWTVGVGRQERACYSLHQTALAAQ